MAERTCAECGVKFSPTVRAKTRRWCYECLPPHGSPDYLLIYKRLMRAEALRQHPPRTCEECGIEFRQITRGPDRRWCYECVPKRPTQLGAERSAVDRIRWRKDNPKVIRTCEHCGVEFDPGNKVHRRWCMACLPSSRAVPAREYRRRLHELDPSEYERYIAQARASAHKRRARKMSLPHDDGITIGALLERDGPACHICGKRVHTSRQHPHPMAPTIDHIVPLTKQGSHTWANVAVAHFRCNCVKGNRAANDQLRLIG